jgi:DNA-binding SARP family transcriptional activator
MIDIALLGGVSVNVDGVQLSGEAAQRRRVALLALLAAPALRPVSAIALISWLWPDHQSARHLLSAALHVLRKALGADALLTAGDDVALNPALVAVDAAAFRAAVAGGDVEGALSHYGGEFMEGFFVNDAGDFAQWVDGERDGLKRLYGETLERAAAARAAAGNTAGAAEAWRRRAAVDPYDARVALELMRALAASGQRGAAIQHARLHAQLLEHEFGAEPDPQVEALAVSLRQTPADARRPAHVPGPAAASTQEPPAVPHSHETDSAAVPGAEAPGSPAAPVLPAAAPLPAGPPIPGRQRSRPWLWLSFIGGGRNRDPAPGFLALTSAAGTVRNRGTSVRVR